MGGNERRACPRRAVTAEIKAWALTSDGELDTEANAIGGSVRDASGGGLGVHLDREVEVGANVRCEICFHGGDIAVPTLAQVQWIRSGTAGIRFLL